ncbi:MAG TPA: hypothetical protein EYM49_07195 [Campylobacterales bacterium]|nr:hypothetical protein [Campylobacterales bacterium]
MKFLYIFIIFTLFTYFSSADNFSKLNPPLTQKMQTNRTNSTVCDAPVMAKDSFTDSFHYGCFCGEEYPALEHSSKKSYKDLNQTEKEELITQYYNIKPYDSIDESCQKHDICYIAQGEESQSCNKAIYKSLKSLKKIFKARESEDDPTQKQCKVLASDMASFFKTIFSKGEDISFIQYSILAMTTPITMASKSIQKSTGVFSGDNDYPSEKVKCFIDYREENIVD